MPELPEVETIVRELKRKIIGKKIKSIEIKSAKSLAFKRFQASQNDYNVGLINNLDAIESQKYYLDLALQEHALVASLQESYLNCWLQTGQKP